MRQTVRTARLNHRPQHFVIESESITRVEHHIGPTISQAFNRSSLSRFHKGTLARQSKLLIHQYLHRILGLLLVYMYAVMSSPLINQTLP